MQTLVSAQPLSRVGSFMVPYARGENVCLLASRYPWTFSPANTAIDICNLVRAVVVSGRFARHSGTYFPPALLQGRALGESTMEPPGNYVAVFDSYMLGIGKGGPDICPKSYAEDSTLTPQCATDVKLVAMMPRYASYRRDFVPYMKKLSRPRRARALLEIVQSLSRSAIALGYKERLFHRDLKADNVLFHLPGVLPRATTVHRAVLADLGTVAPSGTSAGRHVKYMPKFYKLACQWSPEEYEAWDSNGPTYADGPMMSFGLGCIICEFVTGAPPVPLSPAGASATRLMLDAYYRKRKGWPLRPEWEYKWDTPSEIMQSLESVYHELTLFAPADRMTMHQLAWILRTRTARPTAGTGCYSMTLVSHVDARQRYGHAAEKFRYELYMTSVHDETFMRPEGDPRSPVLALWHHAKDWPRVRWLVSQADVTYITECGTEHGSTWNGATNQAKRLRAELLMLPMVDFTTETERDAFIAASAKSWVGGEAPSAPPQGMDHTEARAQQRQRILNAIAAEAEKAQQYLVAELTTVLSRDVGKY